MVQQEIRGALDGPIVRGIIADAEKAFGFDDLMRVMKQIVHAEKHDETSAIESAIAGLGSFDERIFFKRHTQAARQPIEEIVFSRDAQRIGYRRGIRKSRARRQSGFVSFGHVGDAQRNFRRAQRGSLRQTPAFCGRKMPADHVDLFDGRAAGDQRAVKLLKIGQ